MRRGLRAAMLLAAAGLVAVALAGPLALTLDPKSGVAPGAHVSLAGGAPRVAGVPVEVSFARDVAPDPASDALLVVTPSVGYRDAEVLALRGYLAQGGRLLLADDRGVGADLLARLAVGVSSSTTPVYSPVFVDAPDRLVTLSTGALPGLPPEVVLSRPVLLTGGEPILRAPDLAWLDENDNGRPDLAEPLRSGALAVRAPVGEGEIFVVGDPDVMADEATTRALLAALGEDGARRILVDESHRALSDPLGVNALLAGGMGAVAATGILMLTVALAAAVVLRPRVRRVEPARAPVRARSSAIRDALEELE